MTKRDVIVSGGGINWCWYHWLTLDDKTMTAVETRADRFHRFNEWQGADNHPTPTVFDFDVYHAPDMSPRHIAIWGAARVQSWAESWAHNLKQWGLPPDTRAAARVDGKYYAFQS